MKKGIALLMALVMVFSLFTGCSKENKEDRSKDVATTKKETTAPTKILKSEPVKLRIWYETDDAIAVALQTELDKLSPDIEVKVERKDKMTEALKLVGNDPKSAPDMYFFAHDKIGVYAEMGILAPITDFISMDQLGDMIPMTISAATYKDTLYQLPLYFETMLFLYNKDLMKEVPKTTDDLLQYMKDNTKDGTYGFVEQHSTAYFSTGWIHAFGGYVINDKAEPGLDLDGTVKALEYHKHFVKYMPMDGDYSTMTTLFKEGKAHSTINLPALIKDAADKGINVGVSVLPTVNETGKAISPYSGVQGVCVLKKAAIEKKEAITKVLQQLIKPEIGIALASITNSAPANLKCYDDSMVSNNEIVMTLKASADNVVPMPNVPEMDVMWSITENLLSAVNKNGADETKESKAAQKEALSQIQAMK